MFYIAGKMFLQGATDQLYDQAEHQRRLHELFPDLAPSACLPFRYPPYVAVVMGLFALFPYPIAFVLFTSLSLLALFLTIRWLDENWKIEDATVRHIVKRTWLCWPVILETLLGGQASLFACLIVAAVIRLTGRLRWLPAGMVLALAFYKPNVCSFLGLGLVL